VASDRLRRLRATPRVRSRRECSACGKSWTPSARVFACPGIWLRTFTRRPGSGLSRFHRLVCSS
jgi:hypothetical protein